MACTRADSASDLGSSDFRGRSRNSLSELSVLLEGSLANSESAIFHWFVRFCRSRNFRKKEKFRERRSGGWAEIRPRRLNFLFALVLKFLERQNFHSFVGPLSGKLTTVANAGVKPV